MKRLPLWVGAALLAGCGSNHTQTRNTAPPPPPLSKRCGIAHTHARTLWFHAADGTKLDGAELGSGERGVIMLHEFPGDVCGWAPYAVTLARRHFHVLLIDLRTFGLSARGPVGGSRGAIADVRGSVRELKELGAKRVALVGGSYGGVTALVAAPALGSQISGVASFSGELSLGSLDALAAVRHLRVPLLIMGSRVDRYLDAHDANKLIRAAGSADKSLVEYPGGVHGWDLLYDKVEGKRADAVLVKFLTRVTE